MMGQQLALQTREWNVLGTIHANNGGVLWPQRDVTQIMSTPFRALLAGRVRLRHIHESLPTTRSPLGYADSHPVCR